MDTIVTSAAAATALQEAEEQLADLTRARAKADKRKSEVDATRRETALAGLSTNATALDKRRLAESTDESLRIGAEIDNLSFAIAAANEKVEAARIFVGTEAAKIKARQALELSAELEREGAACDAALSQFLASYDAVVATANQVRSLRIGRWPGHEAFAVGVRNSIQAALTPRRLNTEPLLLSPSQRHELGVVLDRHIQELRLSLARVIDGTAAPVFVYDPPPPLELLEGEAELLRAEAMAAAEAAAEIDEDAPEAEAAE
jgi:hypothetical protein